MIENLDTKKLVIIGLILLLIYINLNSNSNKNKKLEKMTSDNVSVSVSVRKLKDYYTHDKKVKILNLKYKIDNVDYILGTIDTTKINSACAICHDTEYKNLVPVLIKKENTINKKCYNDELIKCLNNNDIADCETNSLKLCDINKISSDNLEFILQNIKERVVDPSGNVQEQFFNLKVNDPNNKETVMFIYLAPTILTVTNKVTNVDEKKLVYNVCCNKNLLQTNIFYNIYLEQFVESQDKIRFRIYFMVPEIPITKDTKIEKDYENPSNYQQSDLKKKYLGFSGVNLCDDIICKIADCKNNYKYLTLYNDPTHKNIIVFEPELIRFEKST